MFSGQASELPGGGGGKGLLSGLGGLGGKLASFMGGPWGSMLGGLGSLFGGNQSMEYMKEARNDILNMPGMNGPSNLMGDFGMSQNGMFGFNNAMGSANNALGGALPGMFNMDMSGLQQGMQNMGLGDAAFGANQALQQQMGAMNQGSMGVNQGLMGMGMQNMLAAGDSSGLQAQELANMRAQFAPQAQQMNNQMMDRLHGMGLLGGNTNNQNQSGIVRGVQDSIMNQDFNFQNASFDRGMQRQNFLGNLGTSQMGQGLGAESQAFQQALAALGQNQNAAMSRLQGAQGLFGMQGDMFSRGVQGAGAITDMADFGLRGAAMPFQLQSGLLQGSGYHSGALAELGLGAGNSSAGFFSGLFG